MRLAFVVTLECQTGSIVGALLSVGIKWCDLVYDVNCCAWAAKQRYGWWWWWYHFAFQTM